VAAGDDYRTRRTHELRRQAQRIAVAGRVDCHVASLTCALLEDSLSGVARPIQFDQDGGAHFARDGQGKRTTRNRYDACSGELRELDQRSPQKADTHDGDELPGDWFDPADLPDGLTPLARAAVADMIRGQYDVVRDL